MDTELLVVPNCANEAAALDLLTRALSDSQAACAR